MTQPADQAAMVQHGDVGGTSLPGGASEDTPCSVLIVKTV